jgi:hypothetical protein
MTKVYIVMAEAVATFGTNDWYTRGVYSTEEKAESRASYIRGEKYVINVIVTPYELDKDIDD